MNSSDDSVSIKFRFKTRHPMGWMSMGFVAGQMTFDSAEEAHRIREQMPHLFIVTVGGSIRDYRIALFKCTMMHEIIE